MKSIDAMHTSIFDRLQQQRNPPPIFDSLRIDTENEREKVLTFMLL